MAIQFAESGGQYHINNVQGLGIWATTPAAISTSAPAGRSSTIAYTNNGNNLRTPPFPVGAVGTLYAGFAVYYNSVTASIVMAFTNAGAAQCDLRLDSSGHMFFTRNGTTIGSTSTQTLTVGWHYVEFKVILSTSGAGTCEVVVDGVTWVTSTSLTNATTTALADTMTYTVNTILLFARDFYVVDGGTGVRTTYLGDINVVEVFPTGPGTNSQWSTGEGATVTQLAANGQASFTLTSVNTAGVYQGTITGGASNAYVGLKFTVTGFVNGANNQTSAVCTASTATALTLGGTTISETHAGTATFDAQVQMGIAGTGTRPPADAIYAYDSTANDKSDWAHQALALTGSIAGVLHRSSARKDDAGIRQFAQITVQSAAVSETSATYTLGNSYTYYTDVLEQNPTGPADWTPTTFNAATFGVKEIT